MASKLQKAQEIIGGIGRVVKQAGDISRSVRSIIRSLGPFLISQSDQVSEAFTRHRLRLARVDAAKTFLDAEAKSIAEARDLLRRRYIDAPPEDRIRIRRDINESEADLRQLNIAVEAIKYLPRFSSNTNFKSSNTSEFEETSGISEHWIDKFNHLSRSRNEPWRQDLLSRALAYEATRPGSVSPRMLWLIGTLEEIKFKAFATILDLSAVIKDGDEQVQLILDSGALSELSLENCEFTDEPRVTVLIYMLCDTGLLGTLETVFEVVKGDMFLASYGNSHVRIFTGKSKVQIKGVLLSCLGSEMALIYQAECNDFGYHLFNEGMAELYTSYPDLEIEKQDESGCVIRCLRSNKETKR